MERSLIIVHRRDLLVCRVSLRMAEGEVARSTSPEAMVFVWYEGGDARRRMHALPCLCLKFWTGHRRDLPVCRASLRMAEGEVARSTSPEAMVFVWYGRGDPEA